MTGVTSELLLAPFILISALKDGNVCRILPGATFMVGSESVMDAFSTFNLKDIYRR